MINRRGKTKTAAVSVEEATFTLRQVEPKKKNHLFAAALLMILMCFSLGCFASFRQLWQGKELLVIMLKKFTRPRLFLHVGPGKMGTTTIQAAINADRKSAEYVLDKLCPFVDNDFFLKFTQDFNAVQFKLTPELTQRFDVVGAALQECFKQGLDVILSSEFLGDMPKEQFDIAFAPIFLKFEVKAVIGYRRFFDWLPSLFFQLDRKWSEGWSKWPNKGEPRHIFCAEFLRNPVIQKLYTEAYINNWLKIVKTRDKIIIHNAHEDKNLLKTLYCQGLHARSLCEKQSVQEPPPNKNVGFSTVYDSIALAAFDQGLIAPNGVSRQEATKLIKRYFMQMNMTDADFPQTCFPDSDLEEILETTKRVESTLLPDFYSSVMGQNAMEREFQKIRRTKYCTVAADEIVKKHNFTHLFSTP